MSFSLRQLRYFVSVAESGTVSGAAQGLAISQSAVTAAVKDLEADLGVSLFIRRSRGLELTRQGHVFLRHAKSVLSGVSAARQSVSDDRAEVTGSLSLGVTSLIAGYVLSDVLARYRRANPAVDISAIEDNGDYLEHLLIGGELDVSVMVMSDRRDLDALNAEIIAVSPYRLWLPSGHRLETAEKISTDDLSDERLIMLTVDEIEEATSGLLRAIGSHSRPSFRTRSVEAVRSLVATGAGIALLPELVYRPWSLEGDRIVSRDIAGKLPIIRVCTVWRRGMELSPAAKEFVNFVRAAT